MARARGSPRARWRAIGSVLLILAALSPIGLVGPAAASCAPTPPLELALPTAQVAFVGTVTSTTNANRWVTVRVEERWRGPELPETVEVRGGAEPGTATSVDRSYSLGRYLFVVRSGAGYLVDDLCTPTTQWTDDLARHRPPTVRPNLTGGEGESPTITFGTVAPVAALVIALIIAVIAYLTIVRARKRPPDWIR
jgi:hypothetical protein